MVTHIIRKHLFPVLGLSLIKRKSCLIYFFLEKRDIVYTYPTTLSILSEVEPLCIVYLLKRIQGCTFISYGCCLKSGLKKKKSELKVLLDQSCMTLQHHGLYVAHQAPLSMEFSRQEYWSELPFPPPGDLSNLGIEPGSPALQADSLLFKPPGKPHTYCMVLYSLLF